MPIRTAKSIRFAVLCDQEGRIRQTLIDEMNGSVSLQEGRLLASIVDPSGFGKLQEFLSRLRAEGYLSDWEFIVGGPEKQRLVFLVGRIMGDDSLIAAATSRSGAHEAFRHWWRLLSSETKGGDEAPLVGALHQDHLDAQLLDELTRLNNELVNAQRELSRKNVELSALLRLKDHLLSMASHDLRNPLWVVISGSRQILTGKHGELSRNQRQLLNSIERSASFMLLLIQNLLDMAAFESGQARFHFETIDLVAFVRRIVATNRVRADDKEISLAFHSDPGKLMARLDKFRMEQVLNNLLSNAIKFSHAQSEVRVLVSKDVQKDGREQVLICVQDQGIGIDETGMTGLFEPLAGQNRSGTAGEVGTGMGLALSRGIIESHGGKLWAESVAGKGSTFHVSLPLGDVTGR